MTKILRGISAIALFVATTAFTVSSLWKNDKAHSQLGFTVTHLGINDVSGTFNDFDVTLRSEKPDFSDAVFEVTAKVSSIDTHVEQRDNHLKSPDFFDAEKYPQLTFKSTSVKKTGKDKYIVTGDLTLRGVTKKTSLELLYRGTIENPMSKAPTAGFNLTGTIKRSDFGIGSNFLEPMISDVVRIHADGEFVQ